MAPRVFQIKEIYGGQSSSFWAVLKFPCAYYYWFQVALTSSWGGGGLEDPTYAVGHKSKHVRGQKRARRGGLQLQAVSSDHHIGHFLFRT